MVRFLGPQSNLHIVTRIAVRFVFAIVVSVVLPQVVQAQGEYAVSAESSTGYVSKPQASANERKVRMVRFLGPQPNLDHLKNQAKALRNAHRQRDSEVCPTLRHLHRFADATDKEILTADVSLTDVQFALAMDYGFDSWQALRQAVLSMKPSPDYVSDAQDGAMVLPNPPAGIASPANRFAAAFSIALSYMGAPADLRTVMGDSGLAFIFQADGLHHPFGTKVAQLDMGWWPLDHWGATLRLDFLGRVNGVPLRVLPADGYGADYRADPALHYRKYHEAEVNRSLDQGRPVVALTQDHHVVFGRDEGNPPLLGQLACESSPILSRLSHFPWHVFVLDEPEKPIDRQQADVEALEFAVRLGRDEVDLSDWPGKTSGQQSLHLWLAQLEDPELRGPHFYHANVVGHLRLNRATAAAYLRDMSARHPPRVRDSLAIAASHYDAVVDKLEQADTSEEPWKTDAGASRLLSLIRDIIDIEASAQEQMADAIESMR